jgi:hypothetical protein
VVECRALCSLRFECLARNEAYYYDLAVDGAAEDLECVDLSSEECDEAKAATRQDGAEPIVMGPLRDAAVGEECRVAFATDELAEEGDVARRPYAGDVRATALNLMKHKNSYGARRFKRLREELAKKAEL